MNLTGSTMVLAATLATLGCHDTTAPAGITRIYVLESVNGNPLPTITSAGAGDTVTALWATLTLTPDGQAVMVDHLREAYLAYPPEERTLASQYQNTIAGDSITVGFFGTCLDLCISNQVGSIADSSVSLIEGYNPYPVPSVIRLYRLIDSY